MNELENNPNKICLISALSAVEICNSMTIKANHETQNLEVTSRPPKCKLHYLYYNDDKF